MTRTAREGAARARPNPPSEAERLRHASPSSLPYAPDSAAAIVAWLALLPCVALTAALVAFLAPPLSDLLYSADLRASFLPALPGEARAISPEPVENTRFLLSLTAPLLLAAATVWGLRRWRPRPSRASALAVAGVQAAGAAFVVACLVAQRDARWGTVYFDLRSLAVAALLAAAVVLAVRTPRARETARGWLRDTRARRIAAAAVALLVAGVWVLPAVNTETSSAWALASHDAPFHLDETFAVIDHLTPLTDFNAQYASLLPYLIALVLLLFGKTLLVFTIALCALTVLALMAIYGVLRRTTGSALAALLLFVPFAATSLFSISGGDAIRFTFGTYFPMFPLRYLGPYLLAWLLARRLQRGGRAAAWPLFLAAGAVLLNNYDFGSIALAATAAAVVATLDDRSPRALLRLAGQLALGVGGALAAYALFSLVRAGELPHFTRTFHYARLYGTAGYSNFPLPGVVGLQLVIFATYLAAIGTAVVRAATGAENRVLTGMLAWVGVFGLGAASYYVIRSGPVILPSTFSPWTLALALLAIAALARMATQPGRLPGLATLAVLFGVGVAATSVAQMPWPPSQLERVDHPPAGVAFEPRTSPLSAPVKPSADPAVQTFVASLADGPDRFAVREGAPVALFATQGHRLADAYGVVDVVPYTGPESIHTTEQLDESLDALADAGGNTALVDRAHVYRLGAALRARGFALLTQSGLRADWPASADLPADALVVGDLTKWVDTRRLRPAALG